MTEARFLDENDKKVGKITGFADEDWHCEQRKFKIRGSIVGLFGETFNSYASGRVKSLGLVVLDV
jgi:hypothetical protein